MEALFFWVFAVVSVVAGVLVITRRNPVTSALWLVVVMFCLAGLFLLLHGFFLAAAQVIVYAGAIMVLFLFVIMLLNLDDVELGAARPTFVKGLSVALAGGLVLLVVAALLAGRPAPVAQPPAAVATPPAAPAAGEPSFGDPEALARLLFTDYLIPFELASVLLLAAMVGAVVLAKRELRP
ncbi:MAG TPA: NADH-quinone oxidoreductase subunit J [Thermodesulfobacteriota bacterium]